MVVGIPVNIFKRTSAGNCLLSVVGFLISSEAEGFISV